MLLSDSVINEREGVVCFFISTTCLHKNWLYTMMTILIVIISNAVNLILFHTGAIYGGSRAKQSRLQDDFDSVRTTGNSYIYTFIKSASFNTYLINIIV